MFAETELGYYMVGMSMLFYADKSDLSLWVPVCNKSNCMHPTRSWNYTMPRCNARNIHSFVIRSGRIYFTAPAGILWENYMEIVKGNGVCIASRALDGTDLQLEYFNEDMMVSGGGMSSEVLNREHWLFYANNLNKDGSYTVQLFRVTDEGTALLADSIDDDYNYYSSWSKYQTYGDETFFYYGFDEDLDMLYSFVDGELVKHDFSGIECSGSCYHSGNQIRVYRQNDGYYDIDLQTREEVRVGDAQLPDATSTILLPNCIIETTLPTSYAGLDGILDNLPEEPYAMKLFDGESWRDVQLPKELLEQIIIKWYHIQSVTSDSIFFSYMDLTNVTHVCRIPLGTDTLVAEECFTIR